MRTKKNPEIPMVPKVHLKNVEHQRDQFKAENEKLSEQYNKMLAERNSLIDDLSWYRAKVGRLERENEKLKERNYQLVKINDRLYLDNYNLEQENKALRLQSDTYFEQWQQHKALNNEISQHIGNKPSSSTYKYFRAKLDGIGIKEGE